MGSHFGRRGPAESRRSRERSPHLLEGVPLRSTSGWTYPRTVDRADVYAATARERCRIADLIDSLDEAQLATPSLCAGWDVKTVAAHLVSMLMDGPAAVARLGMRYMNPDRAIDVLAKRRARSPADEIAATLRRLADHHYWSPPPRGDRGPLADVLVHSGDIRIALGLPFEPDPQLAAVAIDRLTQPTTTGLVPLGRLRRISWRATDINRTWRKGKEIRGPVSALMMAVGGRTALLDALDGPGLPLLRQRICG
jgi:uncharacterized protein (TIGR03083 family)